MHKIIFSVFQSVFPSGFFAALCALLLLHGATPSHAQYTPPPKPVRILAFGDSLTAGYGIGQHAAFPAILQQKLQQQGYKTQIYNAGKSGDTTASGLKRLPQILARFPKPDLVILALGANDYLRRVSTEQTEENLQSILHVFEQQNIPVFLIGVKAYVHPNPLYRWRFNRIFPRLAKKHAVGFMPDFLEGIVQNPAMNIADGIHPNTRGVALMVDNILPHLTPVLDNVRTHL